MISIGRVARTLRAWCVALTLTLLGAAVAPAVAQDEPQQNAPTRVGRVSDVSGELFLANAERANEWSPISRNYPVTSSDTLWVSANGRAEVDFGGGRFWMAGDTNLQVISLDERQLALFVASGQLIVRVRALDPGDVASIETPNTRIDIFRPGHYRIEVTPDLQRTVLAVRDGEAGVAFAGGVQQALAGQQVSVRGDNATQISIQNGFGSDAFDAWSIARSQRYDTSPALSYVAPDMVGARDLDDYGTWENAPSYGAVWFPTTVAVGWAPYRYGDWTWIPPWGWTWVDSAPWGYAPSHYGRWVWFGGRWGWCPGARIARAVWAPALVGWYGGGQWANAAGPVYGWVPLGWGEPFNPGWGRCTGKCWRRYNQPYAVTLPERPANPPAHYANAAVPGALTAVPASILADARPVAANIVNVSAFGGGPAPVLGGAPSLRPPPGHYMTRPVVRAAPVPAGAQYQMMTRSNPPPAAVVVPQQLPAAAAPLGSVAPRRAPAQVVPTPSQGAAVVAVPPARDVRVAAPPAAVAPVAPVVREAPVGGAPGQVSGGVPAGRGAYTGVPATPGPKAPIAPERGVPVHGPAAPVLAPAVPVPAPAAPGTMTRNAPVAVVPSQPAAPRAMHGAALPEGDSRAGTIAKPAAVPAPNAGVAGAVPGAPPPQK